MILTFFTKEYKLGSGEILLTEPAGEGGEGESDWIGLAFNLEFVFRAATDSYLASLIWKVTMFITGHGKHNFSSQQWTQGNEPGQSAPDSNSVMH